MSEFFEAVENAIIEYWLWFLIIILGYFFWRYNFLPGLIEALLALALTALFGYIAWKVWIHYIQQDFISGIDFVLLEIVPPREVLRSPKAMELFITNALYHFSFKGGKEEYWQGAVWFWFSLEIASIEGQVHFYIRTPTRIRSLIETQMYAQYPQAQVKVAEDYTLAVDEITPKSAWNAWGCEFGLLKPEAYPIRTYLSYELEKDPKEEYKVDPISPVIEFFGSLQKGEQAWMQIVITPSKKAYHTHGTWFGHHDWMAEARKQLDKLLADYTSVKTRPGEPSNSRIEVRVPPFFDRVTKAMSLKTGKLGFDTGIRVMYIAPKSMYPPGTRTNGSRDIRLIFRQYEAPDANGFNRINSAQGDALGSSIMSLSSLQVMTLANRKLHEYREREFFHLPLRHHLFSDHAFKKIFLIRPLEILGLLVIKKFFLPYQHMQTFVLNTEELATLWHFPGQILKVPTLERIESKEASPPTNLPV